MTVKEFVGRSNELDHIRNWLHRPNGGLVLITGVGGIGKTSLLQKIKTEYSTSDHFVVEYFDLAEQPVAMINQVVHLARTIGFENLPEFGQKVNDLGVRTGVSSQIYQTQVDEAVDTAIKEITSYLAARNRRLLLLVDTFEIALKYNAYEDRRVTRSYEKLARIPDTCFVVAGRDKVHDASVSEEIYPLMQALFGEENIQYMELSGFNEKEAKDFFAELDDHHIIPQEMREKLHLLTAGRPILLSLAVEWLQKGIPLPDLVNNNLSELHTQMESAEERKKLLDSFEFQLVDSVRQLQSPLDFGILYMAHIDRRMDAELLSILLDMDETGAEETGATLLRLSFVKEFVGSTPPKWTLHDEMTVLVNKYAWPSVDISGEGRKELTRKVIREYYLPRMASIKGHKKGLLQQEKQTTILQDVESRESDWERWLLEAETLYYWLKVSKEDGYNYFDELYYDKEQSDIRDQFLIDELKRAGVYDEDKIALRNADDLRRRGLTEDARDICLRILKKKELNVADRIHAHTTLGLIDSGGRPMDAEANFLKAVELSESIQDLRVQSILHNNLGRLYRNLSQLDKSIRHFKQALELAKQCGNLEMASTARNNLAWTHRLDGNLVEADALCRLAIAEHRRRGQERPLAYAYLTKADIDRDRGDLQNAEKHAKQALDIFSRLEDVEGKVQAYRTLAIIYRILQNFDQTFQYLNAGIDLVEKRNSLPLLASLKQLFGRAMRHYATYLQMNADATTGKPRPDQSKLFNEALDALQTSIKLAEQTHNPWEIARSQLEIILIKILHPDAYNEDELNALLNDVLKTALELRDELLIGYVYENRGRIEMRNKRYLEAGKAFGEAACHIANRTGQETTMAFDRLHNELLDDVLSNEDRAALARGILEQLSPEACKENPSLMALIVMCNEIQTSPI